MARPNRSARNFFRGLLSFRVVFPLSVAALYLALWRLAPEGTALALHMGANLVFRLLLPLSLVFCFMAALNLFLTPPQFERVAKQGAGVKGILIAAVSGILSSGPIYAWYPILKELKDRGASPAILSVFLVNRAVKPPLLPLMASLFGWAFVLIFTLLTVAASFCVGLCMDRLLPK